MTADGFAVYPISAPNRFFRGTAPTGNHHVHCHASTAREARRERPHDERGGRRPPRCRCSGDRRRGLPGLRRRGARSSRHRCLSPLAGDASSVGVQIVSRAHSADSRRSAARAREKCFLRALLNAQTTAVVLTARRERAVVVTTPHPGGGIGSRKSNDVPREDVSASEREPPCASASVRASKGVARPFT